LAQDAPPGADGEASFLVQLVNNPLLPMVGIIAIFYLVFVIPERRRKAEEAKRMAAIKKNDRVITAGGLHGTVVNAPSDSDVVTVRLDDSGTLRVKVSRWALTVVADKTSKETPAGKDS
jgi:preprotein translocase subunit YajC